MRRRWNGVDAVGRVERQRRRAWPLSTGEVPCAFVASRRSLVSRSSAARTSFCSIACSSTRLLVFELVISIWPKPAATIARMTMSRAARQREAALVPERERHRIVTVLVVAAVTPPLAVPVSAPLFAAVV